MSVIGSIVDHIGKRIGFWGKLVRNNTGVSALNWFLIMSTLVGLALLVVVMFCMIWEVVNNNTIRSDISGWAAFIAAVATFIAPAGLAKGWSNWSENKFGQNTANSDNTNTTSSV